MTELIARMEEAIATLEGIPEDLRPEGFEKAMNAQRLLLHFAGKRRDQWIRVRPPEDGDE